MIWLTSFSFAVLLFTYQHDVVESKKHSSGSSKSPWANPAKANNFMKCLIQKIGSSSAFPQQDKEDMESIVETMMSAMSSMSNSKGSSGAALQAMNMAFASSMAELVIAEDASDAQGIAVKTEALAQSLKQCFRSTLGHVNRHFITEIKDLIGMFAKEAAAEAAEEEEGDDGMGGGDSSFSLDAGIGGGDSFNLGSGIGGDSFNLNAGLGAGDTSLNAGAGIGNLDFGAGDYQSLDVTNQLGGSGDVSAQLSQNLASTLANSDILRAVFTSRITPNMARNIIDSALPEISRGLNLDFATSSQIKSNIMRALVNVKPGSPVIQYIQAIVPVISSALSSKGMLNQNTKNQVSSQITTGMIKGVASAASRNGINLTNINLQDDLLKVKKLNDQLATRFGNEAYPTSLDSTGGYAGGLDAGVDVQIGGAGSSGADLSSKLASTLGNALLQSDTFRGAFKRGVSSAAAGGLINAAVQQISADLGLDANTSGQLRSALLQAVTSVPQGSDSNSYAQAIAPAFARVLVSTNKINARNAKQLGSNIATGLVKSVSVNAPRYGIRLPAINLDADLQKVNTVLVQFDASAPLSAGLGGVDATGSGRLDSTDMFSSDGQDMSDANRISGSDDFTSSGVRSALSLGSILNSPNGLKSPLANNRIKGLTSSLAKAVGPNGFNANVFARGLKGTLSQLSKSGMSPEQAKVEGLMEALVALVQILNSCQIGPVNTSNMSSTSNSMASALSLVMV